MGAGAGTNFMPDDRAGVLRPRSTWLSQRKILNSLGVEMNFAMLVAREAFQQLGKCALGAMPAINEG